VNGTVPPKNAKRGPLVEYLPAIYHRQPFLTQFLLPFEELFHRRDNPAPPSPSDLRPLAELIDNFDRIFDPDPEGAPDDFLPWLASWTAFSLRFDLTGSEQREFLKQIIPLYRRRGTPENLKDLIRVFTKSWPEIDDGPSARPSKRPGAEPTDPAEAPCPHFFSVKIVLPMRTPESPGPANVLRQIGIARAIIELEKPAHTEYKLWPEFPSMRIGEHSTVGVDTLIGTIPKEREG